jgi:hypothetical protein
MKRTTLASIAALAAMAVLATVLNESAALALFPIAAGITVGIGT